jgi:hypothetical protein
MVTYTDQIRPVNGLTPAYEKFLRDTKEDLSDLARRLDLLYRIAAELADENNNDNLEQIRELSSECEDCNEKLIDAISDVVLDIDLAKLRIELAKRKAAG